MLVAATSKKLLSNFELMIFAPPTRPLVNNYTHKIMVDVLGDLTYNFSHEKGCEALAETWRKTGPSAAEEGVSFMISFATSRLAIASGADQ